ncbi:MAG TPA: hypothetical protein VFU72_05605 [Nitrolancea sp.]|nr:hypothetical protein [Nitrolancea sp.]
MSLGSGLRRLALLSTLLTLLGALLAPAALAAAPTPTPHPATSTPAPRPTATVAGTALVDGVSYIAVLDTAGGRKQYDKWHREMYSYGVPDPDAARIAFAWVKDWCQTKVPAGCPATGFDLSAVDVRDGSAGNGFNDQCQVWGVDFTPQWGDTTPKPAPKCAPDAPKRDGLNGARATSCGSTAASGVCAGGGASDGGSYPGLSATTDQPATGSFCVTLPANLGEACTDIRLPIPTVGSVVRAALGGLAAADWGELLGALLRGLVRLLVNSLVQATGQPVLDGLLHNPDLHAGGGGLANVRSVFLALRDAAVALCLAVFAAAALQYLYGYLPDPGSLLGRLVAVLAAIGFYPLLMDEFLAGINTLIDGVLAAGQDEVNGVWVKLLALTTLPAAAPGIVLVLALVAGLLLLTLLFLKLAAVATLVLLYVVGPLALAGALHPVTARVAALWAQALVRVACWPLAWALELRLLWALMQGINPLSGGAVADAMTLVGLLMVMAATPFALSKVSAGEHVRGAVAKVVGVTTLAAGAAVGGVGGTAAAAGHAGAGWTGVVRGIGAASAVRQQAQARQAAGASGDD